MPTGEISNIWIFIVGVICIFIFIILGNFLVARRRMQRLLNEYRNDLGNPPGEPLSSFEELQSYHQSCLAHEDGGKCLDQITWDDLDMGLVFNRINKCITSPGEEYLYHLLHTMQSEKTLKNQTNLVSQIEADDQFQTSILQALLCLGRNYGTDLSTLLFGQSKMRQDSLGKYICLAIIPFVAIGVCFLNLGVGLILLGLAITVNIMIYSSKRLAMDDNYNSVIYASNLISCCQKLSRISGMQEHFPALQGALSPFNKLKGMSFETSNGGLRELMDIFGMLFLGDLLRYAWCIQLITENSNAFHSIYQCVGKVDIAFSILSFRKSLTAGYCVPTFACDGIQAAYVYHPLVKNSIPNDACLTNDTLITGSNASGKSTFIKTIAINAILAQTIHTCCAQSFAIKPCRILTSIVIRDDISMGDSYFVKEIKSIKRMLSAVKQEYCLCIVDEMFRGTNTIERIAVSTAMLRQFHNNKNCLCIVVTHDIELTSTLSNDYDFYHFREKVCADGKMVFDYLLHAGVSPSRNAIKLMKIMGFDQEILDEAQASVAQIEQWLVSVNGQMPV